MRLVLSCIWLLSVPVCFLNAQTRCAPFVNPMIGTGGHGHTFPGAVMPFGMVQLSPDTRADGSWDECSGYHYSDSLIYGFSHTHLSGTGCSDWGDILVMPVTGQPSMDNTRYASRFSHRREKASAGYYEVMLDKEGIKAELTVTPRTGIHRYSFPAGKSAGILVDLLHRDRTLSSNLRQVDSVTITGFRVSSAWAKEQHVFFAMRFSTPIAAISYATNKKLNPTPNGQSAEGAWLQFGPTAQLLVQVALSPVSEEGALNNLRSEAPHRDFEKYRREAESAWEQQLSKIRIEATDDQRHVFYTALYHSSIHPSLAMDVDGRYRGRDNQIHSAKGYTYYTVFSLWDTYRALHPLITLLEPERTRDFISTFLAQYDASGRLPVWELSSNETDCMIGFHSVSVIADALAKGVKGIDVQKAYAAMKAAASYSGFGIPEFNRKLFLQADDISESVSRTLEYGYDNWCIAQVARLAGHPAEAVTYLRRSQAWRNLYDPYTGFMRPRKNGGWIDPFDPSEINNHFTEGNSWHYSFYVPHDIQGMIQARGGKESFSGRLDELFTASEKTTGREQADVTGLMGQYAHGNEPSHHMAYLYDYAGQPEKTIERVQRICREFYTNAADGLIGNEDCGQMSAWYVFSSLGFYPVCPGTDGYAIGAPLFSSISVSLPGGKTLNIRSDQKQNTVLSAVRHNGQPVLDVELSHKRLVSGGQLEFLFSAGTSQDNFIGKRLGLHTLRPAGAAIVPAPLLVPAARVFRGERPVYAIAPGRPASVEVYATTDGSEPTRSSSLVTAPLVIQQTTRVKARAYQGKDSSVVSEAVYYKAAHNYGITIVSPLVKQYTAEGPWSLIDGLYGTTDWRSGDWLSVQGRDMEAIVDMGEERALSQIALSCLQDTRSWILFPPKVSYYTSEDGKTYRLVGEVLNAVKPDDYTVQLKKFEVALPPGTKTRYIRVVANYPGCLPDWHDGRGEEAHIFVDELELR